MMVSMKQVVSVATLPVHVGDGPKGTPEPNSPPSSIRPRGHNSCRAVLQETA